MEFRVMRYFLAVAQEGNISRAAETLNVTQPNLSRQLKDLEQELRQKLFVRGNRKLTLTPMGVLLKKRAEEMVDLYRKTEAELRSADEIVAGDVFIGGGESYAVRIVAEAANALRQEYPKIRFHFFSGDTCDVAERLDKGLIDFAILIEPADLSKYAFLRLPDRDTWGILTRKDNPLATLPCITPDDLSGVPLIRSRHTLALSRINDWFCSDRGDPNLVATYNLIYNASLMVEAGMGSALTLDRLLNTEGSDMVFVPLKPHLESNLEIAWKKSQVFSRASELFLAKLKETVSR